MNKTKEMLLKEMDGVLQKRSFSFTATAVENKTRGLIDKEKRLVEFSISSETPYERSFGMEILGHNPNEIDMHRLSSGAPFLFMHDHEKYLGDIVESKIENKRIVVVVKLSRNDMAEAFLKDIEDGIRGKISVGYYVKDMTEETEDDADMPVFRVTSWLPVEASSVTIPADNTVGVGRKLEDKIKSVEANTVSELSAQKQVEDSQTIGTKTEKLIITEVKKMDDPKPVAANIEVGQDNSKNVTEILDIASKTNSYDLAKEYISKKKSAVEFKAALFESFEKNPVSFIKADKKQPDEIGMTQKEISNWSLMNYVRNWENQQRGKVSANCFEKEVSDEVAKKVGKEARGVYLPYDVMKSKPAYSRAMAIGSATTGGNLVQTSLLTPMFVDVLRNLDISEQIGFTKITGLNGYYNIPRKTSAATTAWITENGSATESTALYDLIAMTGKTASGNSILSREQRLQSSPDAEALSMYDLIESLQNDIASKLFNGTGSSGQITGLLAQSGINSISPSANGDAPTWALMNQMKKEIRTDNVSGIIKLIVNAATEYALSITPKVTAMDHYLLDENTRRCAGMETLVTNMLPSNITKGGSGATLSKAIALVPENVIVGYWGGLDILIDPYTYSNDGRIRINAFQDVDLVLKHAEAVCVFADIITA